MVEITNDLRVNGEVQPDTRRLERRRKAGDGSIKTNLEPTWNGPAPEEHMRLCQRIANHMPEFKTARWVDAMLRGGERIQTKHSTYYLKEDRRRQSAPQG